jgi:hypothetical protein
VQFFFEWSIGNKVRNGKIDYYSPSFILVVSATYIALFYNTPNPDVRVLLFFCNAIFQYRFSFGNLRAMAMEPVGHIAGIAAAVTGFIYYHGRSYQHFYWPFYCR